MRGKEKSLAKVCTVVHEYVLGISLLFTAFINCLIWLQGYKWPDKDDSKELYEQLRYAKTAPLEMSTVQVLPAPPMQLPELRRRALDKIRENFAASERIYWDADYCLPDKQLRDNDTKLPRPPQVFYLCERCPTSIRDRPSYAARDCTRCDKLVCYQYT